MSLSRDEFEALYRAHAPEILGYLRRRGAGEDAQDLLADTFLVAWRRRDDLPETALRRAWLFGTARRLLLAHRRGTQTAIPTDRADSWVTPATTDDDATAAAEVVRSALAELPEVDRELLTMTVWERLPVVEAGAVLGLSASAARVRLHRARSRLAADPRLSGLLPETAGRNPLAVLQPVSDPGGS